MNYSKNHVKSLTETELMAIVGGAFYQRKENVISLDPREWLGFNVAEK
ncbi:hypothetical protein [Streptococcus mutans]|nr:hypothetical protein [Streptococcus mutans]MDW5565608.1 hypothetical protein [Streptococcus mutans]